MRVGFLFDDFLGGGTLTVTLKTIKYFKSLGIESTVFAFSVREDYVSEDFDCRIYKDSESLRDAINSSKVQLVFVISGMLKSLSRIKQQTNCKYIYWVHGMPNWRDVHLSTRFQKKKYSLLKIFPLTLIRTMLMKKCQMADNRLRKSISEFADAYIVLTPQYVEGVRSEYNIDKKNVYVIQNTQDVADDVVLEKENVIVYMGRLDFPKRVDLLLKIWLSVQERLPDWRLEIYGEGKERYPLEKTSKEYGLKRIDFKGWSLDPRAVYNMAAVSCMTSTFEGVPMSILESQQNGVIPMAFNTFSGLEHLIAGGTGISIKPFDTDKYAEELIKLCVDDEYRKSMQQKCIVKSRENNDDINLREWRNLFKDFGLTI